MRHLTAGQHALLETALLQQLQQLERRRDERLGGSSRAEHAARVLQQDGDDAPQREPEHRAGREVDLALDDRDTVALGELSSALARLRDTEAGRYGLCADCDAEIPFDRLKAEPWAPRCVDCQSAHERRRWLA